MTEVSMKLDADRQTVVVTLPSNPPLSLRLNVAEVDSLLRGLGELRARMRPPIDAEFVVGQIFRALRNPRWVTETDAMTGSSAVHVRDPRYGWLHYLLPKDEARKLGDTLVKQADTPAPLKSPGKPN